MSNITVTDFPSYCTVDISLNNNAVPNLRGKNITFRVNFDASGSSSWICSSSDINNKYLPPNCRS